MRRAAGRMLFGHAALRCLLIISCPGFIRAAEPATPTDPAQVQTDPPAVKSDVLLTGLDRPWSVAVQPSTADLFIAETGAGRVVRYKQGFAGTLRPAKDVTPVEVIVGFEAPSRDQEPFDPIGVLSIDFFNHEELVVIQRGAEPARDFLGSYKIVPGGKVLQPDAAKPKLTGPSLKPDAPGMFSLVSTAAAIYLTSGFEGPADAIFRAELKDSIPTDPQVFGKVDWAASGMSRPTGITISPRGELVIACAGQIGGTDSSIAFVNSISGQLLMNLATGLSDTCAVAYSSKTGHLYVLDVAWDEPSGGLFRLDAALIDGKPGVRAVKILQLERPTAMAFWPDGTLYVTTHGPAAGEGQLLRIMGGL